MNDTPIFSQMFFKDGTESIKTKVSPIFFDNDKNIIESLSKEHLSFCNKTEGLVCVWGGGMIFSRYIYLEGLNND